MKKYIFKRQDVVLKFGWRGTRTKLKVRQHFSSKYNIGEEENVIIDLYVMPDRQTFVIILIAIILLYSSGIRRLWGITIKENMFS